MRLFTYLREMDTDGDGIPDNPSSVRNTVDDGTDLVHNAPGQTYLAGKSLGAFILGADFAELFQDEQMASACRERVRTTCSTLREELWLGDHFAISLGPCDPGEAGYSIYAAQGLLYPLMTGCDLQNVPLDLFARDIESHIERLMGPYGCPHTSADFNVWISQNIWRDLVGTYLGVDGLIENANRYWQFEHARNVWDTGAYTDVYRYGRHGTDLERYPRGTDSFGYLLAQAGMSFDAVKRVLRLAPKADRVAVPILVLADWSRMAVPWLRFERNGTGAALTISNSEALRSLKELRIYTTELTDNAAADAVPENADLRLDIDRTRGEIVLQPEGLPAGDLRIDVRIQGGGRNG
jgi:hypothetical protein